MKDLVHSTRPTNPPPEATLVVGADLRVRFASVGWQAFGFRRRMGGARVQDVFPSGRVHASVLDVLASGSASGGIVIPVETDGGTRFLCAELWPLPEGSEKPRSVLLRAVEFDGKLVVEEGNGRILEANEAAARAFGVEVEELVGRTVAEMEPFRPSHENIWKLLSRRTSIYLGRFAHTWNGRRAAEIEAALLVPDA